jgi:hypothetical protein
MHNENVEEMQFLKIVFDVFLFRSPLGKRTLLCKPSFLGTYLTSLAGAFIPFLLRLSFLIITSFFSPIFFQSSSLFASYLLTVYRVIIVNHPSPNPAFSTLHIASSQVSLIKKEKKIILIYRGIKSGAVAKSYMRKGYLIYEEMHKYFPIYEEAVSHI